MPTYDPNYDPVLEERRRRAAMREPIPTEDDARGWLRAPAWFSGREDTPRPPALPKDIDIGDVENEAQRAFADHLATERSVPDITKTTQSQHGPASADQAARTQVEPTPRAPEYQDVIGGASSTAPGAEVTTEAPAPAMREPLSVRYKDKEGNWKTHTLGEAAPTDIARSNKVYDPTAGFERGGAAGRVVTVRPLEGGGSFTPSADVESMPIGQRPPSYFEDEAKKTALAEARAQQAFAGTLAKDPFARERAQTEMEIGKAGAVEGIKSQLRAAEERRRMEGFNQQAGAYTEERDRAKAAVRAKIKDPNALRQAESEIEDRYLEDINHLKESYGYALRLSGNVGGVAAAR